MVEGFFIQFYIVVHWHDEAGPCQPSPEIIGPMKSIVDRSFFCSNGWEFPGQDFETVIGTAIVYHHNFIGSLFIVGNGLENTGQAFSQQFSAIPVCDNQSNIGNIHASIWCKASKIFTSPFRGTLSLTVKPRAVLMAVCQLPW